MRIIYLGSGAFGLATLADMAGRHEVVAVITQPDRPAGRRRRPTPTPVAASAEALGLPVLAEADVNEPAFVQRVAARQAEAAVVIAFGQKLGPPLIAALAPLVVNLHASLLPAYRGAAPINRAVLSGETQTGLSVIALAERMDAGVVYDQVSTPIDPRETAGELHDRLAAAGPERIAAVLDRFRDGTLVGRAQDEAGATRAPKLSKADGWVDFRESAHGVRCRVHGLTPWPGVRVTWVRRDGDTSRPLLLRRVAEMAPMDHGVLPGTMLGPDRVAVGDGVVRLLEVQVPGGRPMDMAAFARGHRIAAGDRLEARDRGEGG